MVTYGAVRLPLLLAALVLGGCGSTHGSTAEPVRTVEPGHDRGPTDPEATPATRALFRSLRDLAPEHVLFGHQDDLAYGVHWWDEAGRSDVREVAGAYPAVFGWEIGRIEKGGPASLDNVPFDRIRDWMVEAYRMGAVNTVSWHADNPVSGGDSWETTAAVAHVLPGGSHHDLYVRWLDRLAAFFLSVRGPDGDPVPIIFRPFHEMSGGWFWWGAPHVSPDDYRALWRFTVEYLRDRKGVHNLLWAYSTNALNELDEGGYWTWYPGDEYVDVLGFDDYFTLQRDAASDPVGTLSRDLAWLVRQAETRGKIPAFTETGYEAIPDPEWWTEKLLSALTAEPAARRVAWVLVWRNANAERDRPDHFYAPYPGHPSAADFMELKRHPLMLFVDELPDLYGRRP